MTAPERMFVREKPNGAMGRWHDATSLPGISAMTGDGRNPMRPYILATPEALAASHEVQALVMAERERCAGLMDACNQARLAFAGFVSVQSALNKLDAIGGDKT